MMPNDTHPDAERVLIAGYRRMSAAQKLAQVGALSVAVQQLALLDIRRRYPHADAREQQLRLASRSLDAATMRKVFGWDPDTAGH